MRLFPTAGKHSATRRPIQSSGTEKLPGYAATRFFIFCVPRLGKTSAPMIVAMQESARDDQIQQVIDQLVRFGFEVHRSTGARQTVLGGAGVPHAFDTRELEMIPAVQEVHRTSPPYKLAGRSFQPESTVVQFSHVIEIVGKKIVVMAGPC